jgi:hypothetical protein
MGKSFPDRNCHGKTFRPQTYLGAIAGKRTDDENVIFELLDNYPQPSIGRLDGSSPLLALIQEMCVENSKFPEGGSSRSLSILRTARPPYQL